LVFRGKGSGPSRSMWRQQARQSNRGSCRKATNTSAPIATRAGKLYVNAKVEAELWIPPLTISANGGGGRSRGSRDFQGRAGISSSAGRSLERYFRIPLLPRCAWRFRGGTALYKLHLKTRRSLFPRTSILSRPRAEPGRSDDGKRCAKILDPLARQAAVETDRGGALPLRLTRFQL